MTKSLYLKGAVAEGEAEKEIPEHLEGGEVKPKEAGVESDLKEEAKADAGAPPGEVVVVQNQAHAGDKDPEVKEAPYKEDRHAAAGGESQKQNDLGARGVPLGKKELQNDQVAQLKDEERSLDKEKEQRAEREKVERERQERLETERLKRERQEKEAKEQEMEEQRIKREVQARVEKQRLERERKEKLAKEQEQKKVEVKLAREKAAEKNDQQEIQKADKEMEERAKKETALEETRERLAQLKQVIQAKNPGKAAHGAEREDEEALKKGGRDLKEKVAAEADPREGMDDGAVKDKAHPQGFHEKVRDQGEMDLKRKRREVGPGAAGGPPEETRASRGVPGLEPLLELGGSNLHAALEEQLLAGAMVHSRQIKQTSEDKEVK